LIILIKIDDIMCEADLSPHEKETDMSDGLEGVIAARTVLSDVDGVDGHLVIRGYSLDDLAGRTRFEDVAHLLFDGFFDDMPADLTRALGEARVAVFAETAARDAGLLKLNPVEAMRALTARLADGDGLETALKLLAAPAVFTPAVVRAQAGQSLVPPDPSLRHSADILRMLHGRPAAAAEVDALDAYLVTVSDHGLNASTFAARVVASTQAGLTSAVLAGISALKGPLHGGAPGPVIDMLDGIGRPENARAWLEAALDRGERLMGFGHRVYRVRDPRADVLKAAVRRMSAGSGVLPGRVAFAEAVEKAALAILRDRKPDRPLDINVEFYTALLLEALAFPPATFTGVFAMGRVAGWIAHAREQLVGGRLIRPASQYIGPQPRRAA
jgi:citrate synthase